MASVYDAFMRIARILHEGRATYAEAIGEGDSLCELALFEGDPISGEADRTSVVLDAHGVEFLAPVVPTTIVGVGDNFLTGQEEPGPFTTPLMFLKPASAVCGPSATILRPEGAGTLCFEGELAVVIGKRASRVAAAEAEAFILGYTIANDVSARGWQQSDPQWARAKGSDTFCPLGPWIRTDLSLEQASNLSITTELSGIQVQDSNTARLRRDIPTLIEYVTRSITLYPGDVILTGAPEGAGPMNDGDTVSIRIHGLGQLMNDTQPSQR